MVFHDQGINVANINICQKHTRRNPCSNAERLIGFTTVRNELILQNYLQQANDEASLPTALVKAEDIIAQYF